MDKATRNVIQRMTQSARRLLEDDYAQKLAGTYDILPSGEIRDPPGKHLTAIDLVVRERLVAAIQHRRANGMSPQAAVADYVRDAAFTTLNRFVALRLLEERHLILECVSRGEESAGFREFVALAPTLLSLPDRGYRLYLECLFDEVGVEVPVLFDRDDPAGLLWPGRSVLQGLVQLLAAPDLQKAWTSDETIGWVYQYFNSDEDREAARYDAKGKPKAPGDSYELAIRNQFFTPRYVVEFLTDNTLGRLWYEMMQGKTGLANLDFLVPPTGATKPRPKKDPRELRVLDPACGSGHFLLYAFELLLVVYEDAFKDPAAIPAANGRTLRDDYSDLHALRADVPRLILRHNLFGVDIDPRATQIAALALWLRAQRAFADLGIQSAERPSIDELHIVLAEPMPGDAKQVEQFASSLSPPVLGQLFRGMVEQMRLAGELGPLLRIERTLSNSITEARQQFVAQLAEKQRKLPGLSFGSKQGELDLSGITDEAFFDEAEATLIDALETHGAHSDGAERVRRHLFADDARSGVALIDLLRKPFDVVLMNPPFGDPSEETKAVIDDTYPNSKQDLFAVFVERAIELVPRGFIGVLSTEAGFFRRTLEPWRRLLLANTTLRVFGHLGDNVLDGAKVRVAAYVTETPLSEGIADYIRATAMDRKSREPRLRAGVLALKNGNAHDNNFATEQSEFEKLPYAVFGYWCSPELRNAFVQLPSLDPDMATARRGMYSGDDSRFLRLRWEVGQTRYDGLDWRAFAKGGRYSPFHDDVHLVIPWREDRGTLWGYTGRKGREAKRPESSDLFFKPGLTYPPRTTKRFAPRALPAGCAFGHKGPAIVDVAGPNFCLLALLNSRPVSYLLSLGTGATETMDASNSYEVGLVQRLPVPPAAIKDTKLEKFGREAWQLRADLDLRDETTALYRSPFAPVGLRTTLQETAEQLATHLRQQTTAYVGAQDAIDRRVVELYGFSQVDWTEIQDKGGDLHEPVVPSEANLLTELATRLASFLIGAAFGRWKVNRLRDFGKPLADVDPFGPLVAPQMLELPKAPAILVDDPGHPKDIVTALQTQLQSSEVEKADALFDELGAVLDPRKGVRGWLAKKGFAAHLKTYSKSRRKAPIYWQLSTRSGEYSVWLYYHRLNTDTLFRVLNDYVAPKLRHEKSELKKLEEQAGPDPSTKEAKEIAEQEAFVEELRVMREELERVAPLWKPNLDDGVVVVKAPLWRLIRNHTPWRKELRARWKELVSGNYDWSHQAMHLWPERVVPKCAKHRSLAIAHNLEGEFWREDDGKWKPRKVDDNKVAELIAERTSPAVKVALQSLLEAPSSRTEAR